MPRVKIAVNYLAALVIILSLNFLLPRLMPGDPLHAIYGDEALIMMTDEVKAGLVRRFSLDRSWPEQFMAYVVSLARGDLGYSYFYSAPVTGIIGGFLPWTLLLAGMALVLSTALGMVLGIESGWRRSRTSDRWLLGGMMLLSGFPDFFCGIVLLLLFGVELQWLPLAGAVTPYGGYTGLALAADILRHLALPLTALVLVRLSATYLLTRNAMVTVMGAAFVRTARAKGCQERTIRYRHAGRAALLPVATAAGMQFSHLVSGVLLIEVVFSYPGMGTLLYKAMLNRDYPLLQGILLLAAVTVLTVNCLTDLGYARLDPRAAAPETKGDTL